MRFLFNAEEWKSLSNSERVRRCTLLAEEAQNLAEEATESNLKTMFVMIAQEWLKVAKAISTSEP